MKSKRWLRGAAAIVFWLLVWELAARGLNLPFAVPTVEATARALFSLAGTAAFWQTVGLSLLRILWGLLLGTVLGTVLAALSVGSAWFRAVIAPALRVIKCTPVASFIMILWILAGRDSVPQAVAVLMVTPVLWQAVTDGWAALDPGLSEVLTVFRASPLRRLRLLVLPGLKGPFLSALATAAGLAWKSGIAAEIIAYTSRSIGRAISDARNLFDGAEMMAWTLCVIILSLLIEYGIGRLARRPGKERAEP